MTTNKAKLQEALSLVIDMTADVNGEYPVGLLRVRRLLEEVLAADQPGENELMFLDAEPPQPAA